MEKIFRIQVIMISDAAHGGPPHNIVPLHGSILGQAKPVFLISDRVDRSGQVARAFTILASTHRASISIVLVDLNGRWRAPSLRLYVLRQRVGPGTLL